MTAAADVPVDAEPAVLVRHEGSVAVVTLNRPDRLNAVVPALTSAYAAAMHAADDDPAVRAIVVTGAGRGFCSGADLALLGRGRDALRSFVPDPNELADPDELPDLGGRLRKPVIAAVNGPVAGMGFAIMLGSDIRFAARTATISTTFARLGLVAEYGLSWYLPRLIGTGAALDLLLSGRTIDADEAAALGLVHRVTEPDRVLAEALAYATDLAERCSPAAMAVIKAQVYADLERPQRPALASALALMRDSFELPDLSEALAARAAERLPAFPPLQPR